MGKSRANSYKSHRGNSNKHNRRREDWKQTEQPVIFQMPDDEQDREQEQDWRGRHAG